MDLDVNTILHFITGGGLATLLTSLGIIKLRQKKNGGTNQDYLKRIENRLTNMDKRLGDLEVRISVVETEVKYTKSFLCNKTKKVLKMRKSN